MSDEYVKSEEIIETRWKCPSCGAANRGRDMKCPSCGAPKDEAAVYEIDAAAAAIEDAEALADAEAGAHWSCAFCEKDNRGRKKICAFCGADQTTRERKARADQTPPLPARKKPNLLLGCGILLAVLVGIIVLFYVIGSPRKVDAKVVGLEWTQAINLHERTTVAKEDWENAVPRDAVERRCERRQRTTRQVVDHYQTVSKTRRVKYQSGSHEDCKTVTENLDNGYAKRKEVCKNVPDYDYREERYTEQDPVYRTEPVYEQFCRFDVYEWPIVKTVKKEGSGSSGLAWPAESELADGCVPCDAKHSTTAGERCCAREGRYRVRFENPEKPEEKPVYEALTPEEFATFSVGQSKALELDGDKVSLTKDE